MDLDLRYFADHDPGLLDEAILSWIIGIAVSLVIEPTIGISAFPDVSRNAEPVEQHVNVVRRFGHLAIPPAGGDAAIPRQGRGFGVATPSRAERYYTPMELGCP
jgi:hypothetical protein